MSFQHQPLPQESKVIRLLELRPGQPKDPLECALQHHSLESQSLPDYEPLSYCWGDSRRKQTIYLNRRPVKVTRNLHAALLHLRRQSSISRLLWVDAVCINQSDVAEKSVQVQLMREIYQQGSQTLVWLGTLPHRAWNAFKHIHAISHASDSAPAKVRSEQVIDIRALLELPYFTRIWVVQEVAVSSSVRVLCGRQSISWDDLVRAASSINEIVPGGFSEGLFDDMRSYTRFASLAYTRSTFQANGKLDWLRLLAEHRSCLATNAKDKVYALLGLTDAAQLTGESRIVPDYREAYTAEEAFTDVAISLLKASGNLDLLSIPRCSTKKSQGHGRGLPSWVPDWSKPSTAFAFPPISSVWSFSATGTSSSHPVFRDSSKLGLLGYVFDEIERTTRSCADRPVAHHSRFHMYFTEGVAQGRFLTENVRAWRAWRHEIGSHSAELYVTGETMARAFWKTLTGGRPFETENEEVEAQRGWEDFIGDDKGPSVVMDSTVIWNSYIAARVIGKDAGATLSKVEKPIFNDKVVRMSYGRSMLMSKAGYIGLGPSDAQVGDSLAFLGGGSVPYVLRREGEVYKLVGDCYVHGVMHGEIFDGTKGERIWLG